MLVQIVKSMGLIAVQNPLIIVRPHPCKIECHDYSANMLQAIVMYVLQSYVLL